MKTRKVMVELELNSHIPINKLRNIKWVIVGWDDEDDEWYYAKGEKGDKSLVQVQVNVIK